MDVARRSGNSPRTDRVSHTPRCAFSFLLAVSLCAVVLHLEPRVSSAGSTTVTWRGADLRIETRKAKTVQKGGPTPAAAGISQSEMLERIDATVLLMLRALAAQLARPGAGTIRDCRTLAELSPTLFLAPIRPDTVVRPPIAALGEVRFTPLPTGQLQPGAQRLGAALNDLSARANRLLGLLGTTFTPQQGRLLLNDVVASLSALRAQRDQIRRRELLRADSLALPDSVATPIAGRLRDLGTLERQVLADAGLSAPEIDDLGSWLRDGHLAFRLPLDASPDPVAFAQDLLGPDSGRSLASRDDSREEPHITPNPARLSAHSSIEFRGVDGIAAAEVLDARGRRIRQLERGAGAGGNSLSWDQRDGSGSLVPPGVYFVRMHSTRGTTVSRVVLTR